MTDKCPDCGVPMDEIPYKPCSYHRAYEEDEKLAAYYGLSMRPWSQKIEESADLEEMKAHLVDYFWSIE